MEASSDAGTSPVDGVAVVDFYIDNIKVGSAYNESGTIFQKVIDLTPYNFRQGEYDVTAIARDKNGNWAGTFSNELTNLEGRLNRKLTILPPLIKHPPEISLDSPENGLTMPLGSSLRLIAQASDPNGGLKGVQFYANQETVYSWSGILEFNGSNLPGDGDVLTIDDGSGRGSYTFEFNDDSTVVAGDTPILVPAYGNYQNDLSLSGGFDYPETLNFVIEIDGVSNGADTYRWSTDGGNTFVEEKQVIIQNTDQTLSHGLNIRFESNTGHHLGDRWSFVAQPQNQIVEISDTDFPAINGKRTKLRLFHAIHELYELGELSIQPQMNEYDDTIYLRHINDLTISSNVSITGDSLTYLNYVPADDNMILSSVADSTLPQPFGSTWMPSSTGSYVIFAVAEDFSGNRVSSGAIVVSVLDAEGEVPVIELILLLHPFPTPAALFPKVFLRKGMTQTALSPWWIFTAMQNS